MDQNLLMVAGAIVLAIGGYAVMRIRRHSVKEGLSFAIGVVGMIAVMFLIKTLAF